MLISKLKHIRSDLRRVREEPQRPAGAEPAPPPLKYGRGGQILVFAAGSEGDALKEISLDLVRPFRSLASSIQLVDLRERNFSQLMEVATASPIWFVLGFFGAGQDIAVRRDDSLVNLWAATGIPFIRPFGDIPAYFPDRHIQTYPNSINLYVFAEFAEFFRRWFNPNGLDLAMPPILFDALEATPSNLRAKTKGTIVFLKNGNSPDRLVDYWRSRLPATVAKVLEAIAEETSCPGTIDESPRLTDRLISRFADVGLDLSRNKRLLFFMTAQLDDYLRRVKSTMIARALLDFPVVIRGVNWQHIDFSGKRARYDSDSDYGRTRQLLDESLAIVDMAPNVQAPHDRVLRAAGRYTAFLTNSQRYFAEHFADHELFTFDFTPDAIRERIDHALAHPEHTVEMGLRQGQRMRELVDEDHYRNTLIAAVDACALANGGRPDGTQDFVIFPPQAF